MRYIVRFLDDPYAARTREIRCTVTSSIAQALAIAAIEWPAIRISHGPNAGYVIENASGRRILIMPHQR